jgi:hypothetical protein
LIDVVVADEDLQGISFSWLVWALTPVALVLL